MFITTDTEFDKTNLAKEIWKSANMIRVGVVVAHWRSQGGLGVKEDSESNFWPWELFRTFAIAFTGKFSFSESTPDF